MLSSTPSRQPGEEFRRKVSAHWGVSYAQLEALALGEEAPASAAQPVIGPCDSMPPNLAAVVGEYAWMEELPHELRLVVREQARMHYAYSHDDLSPEQWQRILTGLEREALALVAQRPQVIEEPTTGITARKRFAQTDGAAHAKLTARPRS